MTCTPHLWSSSLGGQQTGCAYRLRSSPQTCCYCCLVSAPSSLPPSQTPNSCRVRVSADRDCPCLSKFKQWELCKERVQPGRAGGWSAAYKGGGIIFVSPEPHDGFFSFCDISQDCGGNETSGLFCKTRQRRPDGGAPTSPPSCYFRTSTLTLMR